MTTNEKRSYSFWVLIGFGILLNIIYLIGQTMAVINYDFTVAIGLQESANEVTQVGVALNKGFGLGDTVIYIPLFLFGIIALIRRHVMGLYALFGALAITIYWPIVSLSTVFYAKGSPGWNFADYTSYSIFLILIAVYGVWGMWYLNKNASRLVNQNQSQ